MATGKRVEIKYSGMINSKSVKTPCSACLILAVCFFIPALVHCQVKWKNADSGYGPLPASVQVFKTTDSLDGKPFIAYYVKAFLKDKELNFTDDTSLNRRLTPQQFYEKNNKPLVVSNCTFFNFSKNQNLNLVIKSGGLVSYNEHSIPLKGKDTLRFLHSYGSAIGIDKQRNADIAWLYTDSTSKFAYASQFAIAATIDSSNYFTIGQNADKINDFSATAKPGKTKRAFKKNFKKWKMQTAVGGGPVLVQNGQVKISNNEEHKFGGKAIDDKHPRTCIGYTNDGYLIIMAIQGRFKGIAEGASLVQAAKLLVDLGCKEAINLDGGGSSCMLVNGKETIKPSDKPGQRAVPAVFIIAEKSTR